MAYEAKHLRRQKIRYNSANTDSPIRYQRVIRGAKATPTSATIAVYAPGDQTTPVLTATAMTVSGTLCTYSVSTTTTANYPVATGYRARIASTISAVVYYDDIIFDVCKYLLELNVGRDQLVAMDDRVAAMEHDGDEDFSELIEACRDELQARIEGKVIDDDKLIENMILDSSRVSIPARYLMLAQLFENDRDHEQADRYMERYELTMNQALSSIRYDKNQDQEEDSRIGGIQTVRLVY